MENNDGGIGGDMLNPSPLQELCASEFSSDVPPQKKSQNR